MACTVAHGLREAGGLDGGGEVTAEAASPEAQMKRWLLPLLLLGISLVPASLWPDWLQNGWQRLVWPALNGWWQAVQAASPLPLAPLALAVLLLLLAAAA